MHTLKSKSTFVKLGTLHSTPCRMHPKSQLIRQTDSGTHGNMINSEFFVNSLFWCVAHNAVLTIIGPSHRFLRFFTARHAETTISYFVFGLSGALDFICFATTQIFCQTHGAFAALLLNIIIHHRCRGRFRRGRRIGCKRRRLLFDRRYLVHDFFLFISFAPSQSFPTGIGLCFSFI